MAKAATKSQIIAKMRLERIAQAAWDKGIKATVYNCPEIRTNSTDVFAGVELPLIALLRALKKENGGATSSVIAIVRAGVYAWLGATNRTPASR